MRHNDLVETMRTTGGSERILSERFHRNKDLIDQSRLKRITVIGLGAIGSEIIAQLTIMGFEEIHLWDNDKLELHNLSSTKYPEEELGNQKVTAAANQIHRYNSNVRRVQHPERFIEGCELTPITIVCTDDMGSRKTVYNEWSRLPNKELLIDVRMDSLTTQLITTTKYDDNYMNYWISSSSIEDAVCTMKHTIFCSALAAGHVVKQLFLVLMGHPYFLYEWHCFNPTSSETKEYIIPPIKEKNNEA